jgi:choline dehydrogenase-like flavoprotein
MANNSGKIYDVCIVGSGAGGGVMAQQLSAAGIDVVVLERGRHMNPGDFMQQDELSNMIRQDFFARDYLETQREDSSQTAKPGKYSLLAQTVGGSTAHWGSWCWRFRPDELRVLSTEGAIEGANLADWPIGYAELEPYYTIAEQALGIAGTAGANPFEGPRSGVYPNPPHVYRPASRLIEAGAKKMKLHPFPIPMAINSQVYGDRAKCMNGAFCAGFGCPINAKASTLAIHIPAALATGRCELRTNSRAVEVTLDANGRARGVRYLVGEGSDEKNQEREVRARQVILAGGSIASAQLLLQSRSARFPNGLANKSDQVGRNLMCHVFAVTNFEMQGIANSFAGPPGNIAVDDFHASDRKRGFARGAVIAEAIESMPISSGLKAGNYLSQDKLGNNKRAWGKPLRDYLGRFPHIGGLIAIGEDLPVADNRVDLDPTHRDSAGQPLPRITHKRHANDIKLARYFEQRMSDIASAGGALKTWNTDYTPIKTGSGHIMGTCRMGDDPARSVLDRWCRTHDVDNLWVVDGSFFPTSGGYNPTLTIFANSYRVAHYFIEQAKRLNVS